MSWWDVYGPAACIAAFALGFLICMVVWLIVFTQEQRQWKEDRDWWRSQYRWYWFGEVPDDVKAARGER